ncbi:Predicted arabinose efflux permease, MFS family [Micromonospora purpureochromogenes]|uniref:Predicted arabinose efflux permease, MFS family n=1 Tax=Micromonospora purpureochromogenes TaxID=47872 RepID=A0A1C4YN97_9ACTN|nr:MFS transporter [Micromonospora purpureochromogenes]SCF22117.1 Predicted arabinose efflux permease, MFS family [Micromonospora purpureochromogenes]
MSAAPAIPRRSAALVWAVALCAYVAAVFHRSSLGVTGVDAAHRFDINAAALATFSVAQLAVYAAMQVPVGVLLDRYGSRRLLLVGGALMVAGQLCFAFATDVRLAVAARVLVGLGDAMTFISVLRIVAFWFPGRRNPLMVQLTGTLGQLGAILGAVPLVALLHHAGWTPAFLTAAALGATVLLMVAAGVRDTPQREHAGALAPDLAAVRRQLAAAWAQPGTRLGLWTHFVTQFSGAVFALLWGYPFLVQGQGLSPTAAAGLLTLMTVATLLSGPVVAHLCARHPFRRSVVVFAITAATAAVWAVVLAWPGRAPHWLLVVLVLVLAVNGPGSVIGFDYARTFNPVHRIGSATGIVNVGGFVASIVLILAVGVVLDLAGPAGPAPPTLDAYRWAFAVQYLLWALGAVQVLRYRNAARRRYAAERAAEVVPVGSVAGR